MLSVKVCYDSKSDEIYSEYHDSPIFEFYNEDYSDTKKKSWKLKSQFGAKQLPFVAIYADDTLLKAIWAEESDNPLDEMQRFISQYILENRKSGWIALEKISDVESDNPHFTDVGYSTEGHTKCLMEGCACLVTGPGSWFHTSVINKIEWLEEKDEFKFGLIHTQNSIYKFKFFENESKSNQENAE